MRRSPLHALTDRLLASNAGGQFSDYAALRRLAALLGWAALLFVAYATISPIALRPHIGSFVQLERFGAFMVVGFLFALAYRQRPLLVLAFVVALAVGLEVFQFLTPSRHARLLDLLVKASGGGFGVLVGWLSGYAPLKWAARTKPDSPTD